MCLCLLCVMLCYVLGCLKVLTGFHEARMRCTSEVVLLSPTFNAHENSGCAFQKSIFVGVQVSGVYLSTGDTVVNRKAYFAKCLRIYS